MSKQTFIQRFSLIIKRLERGPADFKTLKHFLETESDIRALNFNLSIRTLQRDIQHIQEQFGIEIVNERKGDKRYYIKEEPETKEHTRRILEAYDMVHILKSAQQHNQFIYFETRLPKGLELFNLVLHACTNKKILTFQHFKFKDEARTKRTVHPIALKEARGRWYLAAVDIKNGQLKTFGLDRMEDLEVSKTSFREKYSIDLKEIFEHAFGVINDEKLKAEHIKLQMSHEQGQYLINFPLHHTQRPLGKEENGEMILEMHLKITYDLIMELMSYGETIKVLAPKSLAKMIVQRGRKMIAQYE